MLGRPTFCVGGVCITNLPLSAYSWGHGFVNSISIILLFVPHLCPHYSEMDMYPENSQDNAMELYAISLGPFQTNFPIGAQMGHKWGTNGAQMGHTLSLIHI